MHYFKNFRVLIFCVSVLGSNISNAGQDGAFLAPEKHDWKHEGILGKFDFQSIQRGMHVYKDVCSACHGLSLVYFRNLSEIGFSDDQVKSFASEYQIGDGPNEDGEMFDRPGIPSDHFPSPYPNSAAAKAANGGAMPPDLSLIIKARKDGANYVRSLLLGYTSPPRGVEISEGSYYNKYFPAGSISMAPPLSEGMITYDDGTESTVEQMAEDVVNFLQWAAEPEMERRKSFGMKAVLFTLMLTLLFIIAKNRVWKRLYK